MTIVDVIFHAQSGDVACLERSVSALGSLEVPASCIVAASGCVRSKLDIVEAMLDEHEIDWVILHDRKPVPSNEMIQAALNQSGRGKLFAVIDGGYEIDGPWFGKVQQIFQKDAMAWMVGTETGWKPNTMPPIALKKRVWPNGPLIAFTRTALTRLGGTVAKADEPFAKTFSDLAEKNGGRRWIVPSIRFNKVNRAPHPA